MSAEAGREGKRPPTFLGPRRLRRVPARVVRSLVAILGYLWLDEWRHYQAARPRERRTHVFRDLVAVRAWLKRKGVMR